MERYRQADLVHELASIFPEFADVWAKDRDDDFSSSSLHCVYQSFLPFVSSQAFDDKQRRRFADHLNDAVVAGGDRANAAKTCVLEHLHQVKLGSVLRPLLSKEAKMHAR